MVSIGITRIRAEMGTPHIICFSSPQDTAIAIAGTSRFKAGRGVGCPVSSPFRTHRALLRQ